MPHGDFSDKTAYFCFATGMIAFFKPDIYFNKIEVGGFTMEPMFDSSPTPEMLSLVAILGSFLTLCCLTFYIVRWNTMNGKAAALGLFTMATTFAYQAYKLDGKFVFRQQYVFALMFYLATVHFWFFANPRWTSVTLKAHEDKKAAKKAKNTRDNPLALVSTLSENIPEHVSFELLESNIITLHGLDTGLAAISASASNQTVVDPKPIFLSNPTGKSTLVDEYTAKKSLEKYGLKIPKTEKCLLSDAHFVSDQIGYPVVLKALGSAHKSELGEVFLNLENQKAVKNALKKVSKKHVIIEKMIDDAIVELLIGIVHDPAHGMLLTIGAGGVLTEILSDTSSLLLPSSEYDVLECFNQLKISRIAKGYRGFSGVELNQIVDAIMKIQEFVFDNRDRVFEIEINPLIVTSSEAIVGDALIREVT